MDLVQLRTFVQVADLGSLSKAATRLRIAQPALSRQIRLLEEELGLQLFDRHGRGMVITDRGRQLLRHASTVLAGVEDLRAEAGEQSMALAGRVAIGMPPTVGDILSVPLAAALRSEHPELDLRLVNGFTGYLTDWLQRGDIDVAVLYDPQASRSLKSKPLLIENLFLIGPPGATLSPVHAIPFERLETERLLLPSPGHGLRAIVERCAKEAKVVLKVGIEADSFATLKDLVRHGHGYTILPLAALRSDIEARRLCYAPLIEPAPIRRLVLARSGDHPLGRAARVCEETIVKVVTALVEAGEWSAQLIGASDR